MMLLTTHDIHINYPAGHTAMHMKVNGIMLPEISVQDDKLLQQVTLEIIETCDQIVSGVLIADQYQTGIAAKLDDLPLTGLNAAMDTIKELLEYARNYFDAVVPFFVGKIRDPRKRSHVEVDYPTPEVPFQRKRPRSQAPAKVRDRLRNYQFGFDMRISIRLFILCFCRPISRF